MSADRDDDSGRPKAGYKRPPKSSQFQKGQSGNLRGRPRKRPARPELIAARHPTREALRAEADRIVIVNDATQAPTTFVSGPKYLAAGDHTIEYLYFEQGGGFDCISTGWC